MLSIISEFIKIMLLNSFFIDKIFDLRIANLCGDGSLGISLRAIGESVLIRSMVKSKNHWISRKCRGKINIDTDNSKTTEKCDTCAKSAADDQSSKATAY